MLKFGFCRSRLGSGDIRYHNHEFHPLGGSAVVDSQVVNLVGDIDGVWWTVLVIDSGEDTLRMMNEQYTLLNSTFTIDSSSPLRPVTPSPVVNPQADGTFESDAASTRSSAHHLGANANLTLDGCLIGLDIVDWYAGVIDSEIKHRCIEC